MSDWVLKPIIVAIISASCYMVGYNEGRSRVQGEWDMAQAEDIKRQVTTRYATQLLEKEIAELKRTCRP